MKRFILTITILLATALSLRGNTDDLLNQRISRIENGLVEFASPAELFQAGPVNNAFLKTLAERMKNFLTPGVSLAVIDHFKLDWAKSYGVLKAGSDQAVAVVLHYVEKGILNLDEDINTYLKSWKFPENDFTRQRNVTLRLLLTH